MRPKALVAMSGGVDSSVAAALMKDAGYDVTGVMMKLWKGPAANNESGCCSVDAAEDARRVAQVLDIPFYVFNFAEEFSRSVIDPFIAGYASGLTPNPCVECNRSVKFSLLMQRAEAIGATFLATGHHARVDTSGERPRLLRGRDPSKDQSYALYMLGSEQLSRTRLPVGEYTKVEVREIAAYLGLRTAFKRESQEICFVPNGDTHRFIEEAVPQGSRTGPILDGRGAVIGSHRGYAHYTVGQRRGLGMGLGYPVYVSEVRPDENAVVVSLAGQMTISTLSLDDVSLVSRVGRFEFRATVATRYRGPEAPATIYCGETMCTVEFDSPQPIPAPGQAAVFYDGEELVGGGTIVKAA